MFCSELKHSVLPLVQGGPGLSKCACPKCLYSFVLHGESRLLPLFCQFRPAAAEAGDGLEEQRHSACRIARWLAVVGLDDIYFPFQLSPSQLIAEARLFFFFATAGLLISQSYFVFLPLYLKQEQQADLVIRIALEFTPQSVNQSINRLITKAFSY